MALFRKFFFKKTTDRLPLDISDRGVYYGTKRFFDVDYVRYLDIEQRRFLSTASGINLHQAARRLTYDLLPRLRLRTTTLTPYQTHDAYTGHIINAEVNRAAEQEPRSQGETKPKPKPNGVGEHVAPGWPTWLTEVATEAIRGWQPRSAGSFVKIDKLGQGTTSNVYKACDVDNGKFVALTKMPSASRLGLETLRYVAREIQTLRRLDHPNVVKLEGLVASHKSGNLYLVFEYMEHDLATLAATPGIKFTEPQIKCYLQQLLSGLHHCHSRGVLHRDIKTENLLLDNNGTLKIADFGLAKFAHPEVQCYKNQPLISRVVTLWYWSPELLVGATNYGAAVDLWSAGCILAELLSGKPIMPGRTEIEQLYKIFKLCGSPSEEFWAKLAVNSATILKPQQPYRRRVNDYAGTSHLRLYHFWTVYLLWNHGIGAPLHLPSRVNFSQQNLMPAIHQVYQNILQGRNNTMLRFELKNRGGK